MTNRHPHVFIPKPFTPNPRALDSIVDGQRKAIVNEPLLADAHERVMHDVANLRDRLFPERPRAEPRTFEAL